MFSLETEQFFATERTRVPARARSDVPVLYPPGGTSTLRGANLRRVRRLSLGPLYRFVRLGGSLLDVERELHVVVVDANAVVRLE